MILLRLALRSLVGRRFTVGLTIFAIGLSVALFFGVEKVRNGARSSFADTISGTDLIVGARTGGVQLLLYSVFRIGNATNNIGWQSYSEIANRPEIDWIVPISLGDSHRGFRVMGTTEAYFDRYRYRGGRSLSFAEGAPSADLFDTVLGADVARELGYRIGDPIVVSHGLASFTDHDDKPFRVSGILEKTGTPVDRTVIVSLEAITAIHLDWEQGAQSAPPLSVEAVRAMDLTPRTVTAALIGVKSRLQVFRLQRDINDYPNEPLMAILPGVALQELWQIVSVAETALVAVSVMVVFTALLGMAAMIFAGLNERRREMAIFRAMGARPITIFGMLMLEAALIAAAGAILGFALLYMGLVVAQPWVDARFGLYLAVNPPGAREIIGGVVVVAGGGLVGVLPALRAYRLSLADGMTVRN